MKKKFLLSLAIVLMLTGCDNDTIDNKLDNNNNDDIKNNSIMNTITEEKNTLICTSQEKTDDIEMELYYKVTYTGNYVELIETVEKITTSEPTVLDFYEEYVRKTYKPYENLEYYYYDIKVLDNTLTSTTKIDYSRIDTDELIEINPDNSSLIKNGKVKLSDVKSMYEAIGATCN